MAVPQDTLTPSAGDVLSGGEVLLENHTSALDASTWAKHASSTDSALVLADGLRGPGWPSLCLYTSSVATPGPSQSLAVALRRIQPFAGPGVGGGNSVQGIALRVSASALTLYAGGYREDFAGGRGFWEVWRFAAGTRTTLGSAAAPLYTDATGRAFRLSCVTGVDGSVSLDLTVGGLGVVSASDPSPTAGLLAAGAWGLYLQDAGEQGYTLSSLDIVPARRKVCGC